MRKRIHHLVWVTVCRLTLLLRASAASNKGSLPSACTATGVRIAFQHCSTVSPADKAEMMLRMMDALKTVQ